MILAEQSDRSLSQDMCIAQSRKTGLYNKAPDLHKRLPGLQRLPLPAVAVIVLLILVNVIV